MLHNRREWGGGCLAYTVAVMALLYRWLEPKT